MELSGRKIEEQRFGTSVRGYTRAEVDAFTAAVGTYVSSLEEHLAIARAKAARAQDQLDSLNADLDARIADAQKARAVILEEARSEAAAIVERSALDGSPDARRAAAVVAEAEAKASLRLREVDGIVADARAKAQHIEDDAAERAAHTVAEAERLLDEARREAKRVRQDSERYRSEMQSHLAGVRDLLGDAASSDDVDLVVDLREGAVAPTATSDTSGG